MIVRSSASSRYKSLTEQGLPVSRPDEASMCLRTHILRINLFTTLMFFFIQKVGVREISVSGWERKGIVTGENGNSLWNKEYHPGFPFWDVYPMCRLLYSLFFAINLSLCFLLLEQMNCLSVAHGQSFTAWVNSDPVWSERGFGSTLLIGITTWVRAVPWAWAARGTAAWLQTCHRFPGGHVLVCSSNQLKPIRNPLKIDDLPSSSSEFKKTHSYHQ